MKVNRQYSRNFLISASAYRRNARGFDGDFSASALREQYEHETHGKPISNPKTNGFAVGKWSLGVTLAAMREDLRGGMFCKAELLEGSSAFVRREIKRWPPTRFFAYMGAA